MTTLMESWAVDQSHDIYHENYRVWHIPHTLPPSHTRNRHDNLCQNHDNGSVNHERERRENMGKFKVHTQTKKNKIII